MPTRASLSATGVRSTVTPSSKFNPLPPLTSPYPEIPLTQEEVAELAGTSRDGVRAPPARARNVSAGSSASTVAASVNAVLGDAQARGLVGLRRGTITIVDQAGLAARAGNLVRESRYP